MFVINVINVWNSVCVCVSYPSGAFCAARSSFFKFSSVTNTRLGRVHLCRVAGNTDPIWQVTSRSYEMGVPLTAIRSFTFFYY